jgi:hypothetical protein
MSSVGKSHQRQLVDRSDRLTSTASRDLKHPPTAVGWIQAFWGGTLNRKNLKQTTHFREWDLDFWCEATWF